MQNEIFILSNLSNKVGKKTKMFNYSSVKGKNDEAWMRNLVPFAVVGSNSIIEVFASMMLMMMIMRMIYI